MVTVRPTDTAQKFCSFANSELGPVNFGEHSALPGGSQRLPSMSDIRQAARKHAQELNAHRDTLCAVACVRQQTGQEIGIVSKVLKDVIGRTSTELYGRPLRSRDNTHNKANAFTAQVYNSVVDVKSRLASGSRASECKAQRVSACAPTSGPFLICNVLLKVF